MSEIKDMNGLYKWSDNPATYEDSVFNRPAECDTGVFDISEEELYRIADKKDLDLEKLENYKDSDGYNCLENAELGYAIRKAKMVCKRCLENNGAVQCCKEDCSMFKAKLRAKEKNFTPWSPCYNCYYKNRSCNGLTNDCEVTGCNTNRMLTPLATVYCFVSSMFNIIAGIAIFSQIKSSQIKPVNPELASDMSIKRRHNAKEMKIEELIASDMITTKEEKRLIKLGLTTVTEENVEQVASLVYESDVLLGKFEIRLEIADLLAEIGIDPTRVDTKIINNIRKTSSYFNKDASLISMNYLLEELGGMLISSADFDKEDSGVNVTDEVTEGQEVISISKTRYGQKIKYKDSSIHIVESRNSYMLKGDIDSSVVNAILRKLNKTHLSRV